MGLDILCQCMDEDCDHGFVRTAGRWATACPLSAKILVARIGEVALSMPSSWTSVRNVSQADGIWICFSCMDIQSKFGQVVRIPESNISDVYKHMVNSRWRGLRW